MTIQDRIAIDKKGNRTHDQERALSAMLQNCVTGCRYVLNDVWFASAENMSYVKLNLDVYHGAKTNRKIALCLQDKLHGRYHRLNQLDLPENTVTIIYPGTGIFPPLSAPSDLHKRKPLCAIW